MHRTIVCLVMLLASVSLSLGFPQPADADKPFCVSRACAFGGAVSLTFASSVLVALQPVEVDLKLVDAQGNGIPGALVYCSLYMPNVATGSNIPKLKATDRAGHYKGIVFFNRAGRWLAEMTINLPNGGYEEVTLEIEQVLPAAG